MASVVGGSRTGPWAVVAGQGTGMPLFLGARRVGGGTCMRASIDARNAHACL
jgi:hypothetical protein